MRQRGLVLCLRQPLSSCLRCNENYDAASVKVRTFGLGSGRGNMLCVCMCVCVRVILCGWEEINYFQNRIALTTPGWDERVVVVAGVA